MEVNKEGAPPKNYNRNETETEKVKSHGKGDQKITKEISSKLPSFEKQEKATTSHHYKSLTSEKEPIELSPENLKISEFKEIFLHNETKIDQQIIKNCTIPFDKLQKSLQNQEEPVSIFENEPGGVEESPSQNFDKIIESHPEIKKELTHLEKEELSDPIEDLKVIWKELEEAKKATGESKEKKIADVLSMIIGAAASKGTSETVSLESTPLSLGPHAEQYFAELNKITKSFASVALTLDFGSSIIENMQIILSNFELQRLSDQMSSLHLLILKKNEALKSDPNNNVLKKEISSLEKQYDALEEEHFNQSLSFGLNNIQAPITALTYACENLLALLPSLRNSGLQSAVSLLSFLGGAVGIATASSQIHQSKKNIVKIQECRQQLTKAIDQLKQDGVSQEIIKMMELRVQNLGKGRIMMEVSKLISAIIKWAGTGGSTAKNFLVGTSLVKGALITKVGAILSAGTALIPAVIGAIAYLRLQRAEIWKSYKTSEDKGTIEIANRLIEKEGKRYQSLIEHPYYQFTQKVDQWLDQLDQYEHLTQEFLSLNEQIMRQMNDKDYSLWKKSGKESLWDYASEEQKIRLTFLKEEIEGLKKKNAKFKSEYHPQVNEDSLLCKYVELSEQFHAQKNQKVDKDFIQIKMKILQKQSLIEAKASELKRSLRNLVKLQRWHSHQISLVEEEYLRKTISSHTKLTKNDIEALKNEISLLWKNQKSQEEIKDYFKENHKELYGQLLSKPIETLMKWVSGIEL